MIVLSNFASRSVRFLALIGSIGTVMMMFHICADVVLRNFFRISIVTTPDLVARYYMVVVAFLPLAWLERQNGMISVELIEWALPQSAIRISNTFVCLFSALVYAVLAWATMRSALQQYNVGTFVEFTDYRMPVWHSYFIPPFGFFLAALICLLKAVETVVNPIPAKHLETTA